MMKGRWKFSRIKIPFVLIAHLLFVFVIYIFQSMVFTFLPINRIVPVLLPIAVVGIAMFEGSSRGGGYGLFAGMLCDVAYNQPVIVMTVVLTVVGILVGILSETVMARGFPTFVLCCLAALMLTSFVSMFSLLFFSGVEIMVLLSIGLKQILYSMIFTVPIYFVARWLGQRALYS